MNVPVPQNLEKSAEVMEVVEELTVAPQEQFSKRFCAQIADVPFMKDVPKSSWRES